MKVRANLLVDAMRRPKYEPPSPAASGWLKLPRSSELYGWTKSPHIERAYEALLASLRHERFALLELGVASGDSLAMWRDGFPRATIVGVDRALPDVDLGPRVHLVQGDQSDLQLLTRLRRSLAPSGFHVIIDDASHVGELSARSLRALFIDHLRPGGLYIIEDWATGYWPADKWPDTGNVPRRSMSGLST